MLSILIFGSVRLMTKWTKIMVTRDFEILKLYSEINIKYPIFGPDFFTPDNFKDGEGFFNEIIMNSIEISVKKPS